MCKYPCAMPSVFSFVSWLTTVPGQSISGDASSLGKVICRRRIGVSTALKMAAITLRRTNTYLGAQFRRFRTELAPPSDQGHGRDAGSICAPHAALWDEIPEPRSKVLRDQTRKPTDQTTPLKLSTLLQLKTLERTRILSLWNREIKILKAIDPAALGFPSGGLSKRA